MALLFRRRKKPQYDYYVVKHSRVARIKQDESPIRADATARRLLGRTIDETILH